jgi:hypothetical protein
MFRHLFAMAVLTYPIVSSAECLTTLPPYPAFIPAAPYSATSPDGRFWYGTDSLWTRLTVDSTWRLEGNVGKGNFYRTKLQYWRKEYDRPTGPQPELIVTAKRIDSEAPLVRPSRRNKVML